MQHNRMLAQRPQSTIPDHRNESQMGNGSKNASEPYGVFRLSMDSAIKNLLIDFGSWLMQQPNVSLSAVSAMVERWDPSLSGISANPLRNDVEASSLTAPSTLKSSRAPQTTCSRPVIPSDHGAPIKIVKQNIPPEMYNQIDEDDRSTICNYFSATNKTYCGGYPIVENNRCATCKRYKSDNIPNGQPVPSLASKSTLNGAGFVNQASLREGLSNPMVASKQLVATQSPLKQLPVATQSPLKQLPVRMPSQQNIIPEQYTEEEDVPVAVKPISRREDNATHTPVQVALHKQTDFGSVMRRPEPVIKNNLVFNGAKPTAQAPQMTRTNYDQIFMLHHPNINDVLFRYDPETDEYIAFAKASGMIKCTSPNAPIMLPDHVVTEDIIQYKIQKILTTPGLRYDPSVNPF